MRENHKGCPKAGPESAQLNAESFTLGFDATFHILNIIKYLGLNKLGQFTKGSSMLISTWISSCLQEMDVFLKYKLKFYQK